jgi:hypothetical protein
MATINEETKEQGFAYVAPHDTGNHIRFTFLWILTAILFVSALLFPFAILKVIPNVNNGVLQIFSVCIVLLCLGGIMRLALAIGQADLRFHQAERDRFAAWLKTRYQLEFDEEETDALFSHQNVIRTIGSSKKLYVIRKDFFSDFYYLFYESEIALKQDVRTKKLKDKEDSKKIQEVLNTSSLKLDIPKEVASNHVPHLPIAPPPPPTKIKKPSPVKEIKIIEKPKVVKKVKEKVDTLPSSKTKTSSSKELAKRHSTKHSAHEDIVRNLKLLIERKENNSV